MGFFKDNKKLLIVMIIICGLFVMWGRSILVKRGPSAHPRKAWFGRKAAEEPPEEVIPVTAAKTVKMDYKETMTSFGTIKGFGEIPIKFKERGKVSKFYFKPGDEIKKGEIVVSQDQDDEKLKLEYADIEYNKNKTMYSLGAITKDKFRQAELELESAKLELEKRNFTAPSDGFMGTRRVNEGELVDSADIAGTFLDISSVYCEAGIIERDVGKVKAGQKVKLRLETFPNDVFEGIVDSVSPMVEGRSRTQAVRILIPNDKFIIKPGMFAKADITTFEKEGAIVVPRKALKKIEGKYVVFGITRNGQKPKKTAAGFEIAAAKIIHVTVERSTEEMALISEGLTEGQEVVLESPKAKAGIKDGGKVEIIGTK